MSPMIPVASPRSAGSDPDRTVGGDEVFHAGTDIQGEWNA